MCDFERCNFQDRCKKYRIGQCPSQDETLPPFCTRLFKINALQDNALLTQKQREYVPLRIDADGSDREAFIRLKQIEQEIETYIKEGHNLYLYSRNTGCGKTSWSLRLLNAYFEHIWYRSDITCKGLFINVPKFLIALRDNISQRSDYIKHIKDNAATADVIVWDDIATKGFTTFEMENIYGILNSRLDDGRSNFYTSNLAGEDLREAMGDRLYSRVMNCSEVIEFVGADKRGIGK